MKFFLPLTRSRARAEYLWRGMRALLEDGGYPTEPRRIHSLFFRRAGAPRILQVGVEDGETGEPVILIYRAANAPYYWVVTPGFGIVEGPPMPIPAGGTRAVDFDEDDPPPDRKRPRRPGPVPRLATTRRARGRSGPAKK